EAEQSADRAVDLDRAEVGPIDLRLLAGQHRQACGRLGGGPRAQRTDNRPEPRLGPARAPGVGRRVQPGRGQPWVLRPRLAYGSTREGRGLSCGIGKPARWSTRRTEL